MPSCLAEVRRLLIIGLAAMSSASSALAQAQVAVSGASGSTGGSDPQGAGRGGRNPSNPGSNDPNTPGYVGPVILPVPVLFPVPVGIYPPGPGPFSPGPYGSGLLLPPPDRFMEPRPAPAPAVRRAPPRPSPAKRSELVTLGDRLFRAKNLKRAEERYVQAVRADPNSAAPYVRLALIELERGNHARAADHFRSAQAAEPGWLLDSGDVQAVYAEPEDFAAVIRRLETWVQGHPDDRDAWLALGAELYLSGRVARAHDIFLRLSDRKTDETITAFLDASTPTEIAREPAPR
ncbi:MAG: tetratricopeptide repeat protein [Isosphaeraceae bacterium]|nr:tetratricopeptide repeat protein [Isosphaeraceae bacterium]